MVSASKNALGFQNPCIHDARKDPQPPCSSVSLREQKGEKKSEWGPPGMAIREATGGEGPALDKVRGPGCTLLGPEPWLGRWAE